MSLPKGYKKLEYIQSSGTQYVNTDFYVGASNYKKIRFEVDCEKIGQGSGSYSSPWMTDGSSGAELFYIGVYNSLLYYGCGGSDGKTSVSAPSGRSTYVLDTVLGIASASGAGQVAITVSEFTSEVAIHLCGYSYTSGAYRCFAQKLYGAKIYENNILVRDFIPCQNASGEIGLWDTVNSVFYGNAGTGTFTAGPEVVIALEPPSSVEQVISVKLAWTEVENASFYRIYRDGALIGEAEDTVYADDTAEYGQTYVYGITACSGSSESNPTELTVYTREGYAVIRPVVTTANFL